MRARKDLRYRDPAEYERRWHAARARQQAEQGRSRDERRTEFQNALRWRRGWRGALRGAVYLAATTAIVLLVVAASAVGIHALATSGGAAGSAGRSCVEGYSVCLDPNVGDYDCEGGSGDGPGYVGPVRVTGSDPFGLDRDGDGYACGGD